MISIVDAFSESVERYPSRIAFSCAQDQLSYRQLAVEVAQLSNYLIESGVQAGDRVAIYMPRCLESAIAVYGILSAGAAFVPIDPGTPAPVVAALLDDTGISVLITVPQMRRLINQLTPLDSSLQVVLGIESNQLNGFAGISWDEIFSGNDQLQPIARNDSDLAYIIHTSGSTGKPKGIMHSHYSGLSYARLSQQAYQITSLDVIGSHAPLHTDMSTLGYLTGPYAGAHTVIIPDRFTKMPASMCKLLAEQKMTVWYSVPLALVQMLSTGTLADLDTSSLRWVIYGGEPFSLKHLRTLSKRLPSAGISNAYGPAEVNQCTHFDLPADADNNSWPVLDDGVPIGRPWPETDALIVDSTDNLVEANQTGELLISSSTMMKGYWNRPELNAAAFLHVTNNAGQRAYYRTGDLVRRDPDGLLWLVGRADRQVKVRGYRVELDHIEMTLTTHPNVVEAGVFAIFDSIQNTNCIIAAVLSDDPALEAEQLRGFARAALADAAAPQTIVIINSLPRTTSGKIDRRRLQSDWQTKQVN